MLWDLLVSVVVRRRNRHGGMVPRVARSQGGPFTSNKVICEQWRAMTTTVWHGGVLIAVKATTVLREVSVPVI